MAFVCWKWEDCLGFPARRPPLQPGCSWEINGEGWFSKALHLPSSSLAMLVNTGIYSTGLRTYTTVWVEDLSHRSCLQWKVAQKHCCDKGWCLLRWIPAFGNFALESAPIKSKKLITTMLHMQWGRGREQQAQAARVFTEHSATRSHICYDSSLPSNVPLALSIMGLRCCSKNIMYFSKKMV